MWTLIKLRDKLPINGARSRTTVYHTSEPTGRGILSRLSDEYDNGGMDDQEDYEVLYKKLEFDVPKGYVRPKQAERQVVRNIATGEVFDVTVADNAGAYDAMLRGEPEEDYDDGPGFEHDQETCRRSCCSRVTEHDLKPGYTISRGGGGGSSGRKRESKKSGAGRPYANYDDEAMPRNMMHKSRLTELTKTFLTKISADLGVSSADVLEYARKTGVYETLAKQISKDHIFSNKAS